MHSWRRLEASTTSTEKPAFWLSDNREICFGYQIGTTICDMKQPMCAVVALHTGSTAQGGGGSFKVGSLQERFVAVTDGWQSEPTDGLTSSWRQRSVVVM